jgi:hypothetical protein
MAAPERIWSGEDSSNDAKSEGDDNEEVVVKPSSQNVIPSSQISVKAGKRIGKTVIPSSTQTSLKSSQSEGHKSERRSSLEIQSQDSQGRSLVSISAQRWRRR